MIASLYIPAKAPAGLSFSNAVMVLGTRRNVVDHGCHVAGPESVVDIYYRNIGTATVEH